MRSCLSLFKLITVNGVGGGWLGAGKSLSGVWNLPVVAHNVNNFQVVYINICLPEAVAQPLKFSSAPVNKR